MHPPPLQVPPAASCPRTFRVAAASQSAAACRSFSARASAASASASRSVARQSASSDRCRSARAARARSCSTTSSARFPAASWSASAARSSACSSCTCMHGTQLASSRSPHRHPRAPEITRLGLTSKSSTATSIVPYFRAATDNSRWKLWHLHGHA